ncbi:DUF58 domain-containing protein [Demequina litorisediminis]|uniref:DUF58 domain-containing protein n=1 Tax=Demequina litorisediminis TaxID=1849022 RepID=A0ABQ6ICV7_9MICO|nr:DUF58 domain-containing protein [Demequina litorisediminis]GMA35555.1 hypothetical protein GCM10025876_17590 [Demequina litorisediminis]
MATSTRRRRGDTHTRTRTEHTRTGHTRATTRTHTQVADEVHGRWVALGLWALRVARTVTRWSTAAWATVRSVTTAAGWAVFAWTVAGLIVGLAFGWAEFLIGAAVGFVLLLIALPFLLGREPYEVDFRLLHESVVAGHDAAAEIVVRNPNARVALPGRVDVPVGEGLIDFHVPLLRRGHEHTEPVVIPAARRGIIDVGPATTVRSDPMRLLQRTFHWADVQTLYIHPVTIAVPSTSQGFVRDLEGRSTRSLTNEDISFHAVREYARGDAQRQIHWKSTAKTGTLMVRQFEETRRSTLSIVLDLDEANYADDQEFEMAVSAAGSLAVRAIRDGRDVQVVVSGEVPEFARTSVRSLEQARGRHPRRLLDDLSGVEASLQVVSMPTLTRMLVEVTQDTSLAFLVTGSHATLADIASAALAFPGDVGVAAVVCDPRRSPASMRWATPAC